jgi:two-component system nitrogen regulation sensor histidine kinase GlnL
MKLADINIKQLLDILIDGIILMENDGQIIFCNQSALDLFSYQLNTDQNFYDFFSYQEDLTHQVKLVVKTKSRRILHAVPLSISDNKSLTVDMQIYPVTDHQGIILGISNRNNLEFLGETKTREDRLNYLTSISSGLTHEIRNPLSGIKGASQLLASELYNKPELKNYADIINQEVDRVNDLLTNLQHFTKPRKLEKNHLNINRLLHDLVTLEKTIDPDRIEFVEEYDPSLPEINADQKALYQVFLNLIKNSREAIVDKGHIIIRSRFHTDVVLKRNNQKKKMIRIEIEDNGEGFSFETQKEIFTPFFTTKIEGSGLGLPLCHQIIRQHEGSIQVMSTLKEKTIFTILIPL